MQRSQLRAARALLAWSQERLAEASGVSLPTVKRLEPGEGSLATKVETMEKLQRALVSAGVEFTNDGEPGVRIVLRILSDARLTGKDYAIEYIHRGVRFTALVNRDILEKYEGRADPKQPLQGRLKRMSWLVAPRVQTALAGGQTPVDGELRLSAAEFRDP
jgi:transcriptional regulator with XRE-family HTH domain